MQTVSATRTESAAWSAAAVSQDAVQKRRTQRLFDLAVEATGLSRKRLARALGIDLRSLDDMRELPSIDYVGRIGGALGLHAAQAVGIVALAAAEEREPSDVLELVRRADLGDDAGTLESLAQEVGRTRSTPGSIALSLALAARAKSARGDTAAAIAELDAALRLGVDPRDSEVIDAVVDCVRGEHLLGSPWHAPQRQHCVVQPRQRRSAFRSDATAISALDARRQAFALAFELLPGLRPDPDSFEVGRALGSIAALRAFLESSSDLAAHRGGLGLPADAAGTHLEERGVGLQPFEPRLRDPLEADSECPAQCTSHSDEAVDRVMGFAWVASIAAAAALRAAELARPSPRIEHAAMQLLVQAELAIEDHCEAWSAHDSSPFRAVRSQAGSAANLLRARRARVQLIEWCQRARGGEDPYPYATDEDRATLIEWGVRFPRWGRPGSAPEVAERP